MTTWENPRKKNQNSGFASTLERSTVITITIISLNIGYVKSYWVVFFFNKVTKSVDQENVMNIMYLDSSKTFSEVDQSPLLNKIEQCGMGGPTTK